MAVHAPPPSDRRNRGSRVADRARTGTERATLLWQTALADDGAPPPDPGIAEALDAHLARRKGSIAAGVGHPGRAITPVGAGVAEGCQGAAAGAQWRPTTTQAFDRGAAS